MTILIEYKWLFSGMGSLIIVGVLGFFVRRIFFDTQSEETSNEQNVEQNVNVNIAGSGEINEDDLPDEEPDEDSLATQSQEILSDLQGREESISSCLAETLSLSRNFGLNELEEYCENELTGWTFNNVNETEVPDEAPNYRIIDLFISLQGKINFRSIAWGGNQENIITYIEGNPEEFMPTRFFIHYPVSQIESQVSEAEGGEEDNKILEMRFPRSLLMGDPNNPEGPIYCYTKTQKLKTLLEDLRSNLSEKLIALN